LAVATKINIIWSTETDKPNKNKNHVSGRTMHTKLVFGQTVAGSSDWTEVRVGRLACELVLGCIRMCAKNFGYLI
jgi:hypothetical protein